MGILVQGHAGRLGQGLGGIHAGGPAHDAGPPALAQDVLGGGVRSPGLYDGARVHGLEVGQVLGREDGDDARSLRVEFGQAGLLEQELAVAGVEKALGLHVRRGHGHGHGHEVRVHEPGVDRLGQGQAGGVVADEHHVPVAERLLPGLVQGPKQHLGVILYVNGVKQRHGSSLPGQGISLCPAWQTFPFDKPGGWP